MLYSIIIINTAGSEFQSLFVYLDKKLDWDNDIEQDLIEIARHLLNWEKLLAVPFSLTQVDIHDINVIHKDPELQRYTAATAS